MLKKFWVEEKGSIMIILTIGLTAFLGFVALVTDVGLLYFNKSKLANAVDAAVLAGGQELPYYPTEATEKARYYSNLNGLDGSKLSVEVFNGNKRIRAGYEKEVKLLFAKVLGVDTGRVGHTAVAEVAPITGVGGAAPLGIQKHEFEFGKQYTLKVGAGDTSLLEGEISPGWFGALALGGPGANTYEDNLTFGYSGNLKIGDVIDIQTGNISGPTKKAIDYRIGEDKHIPFCTVENFERDCARLIKVPVIEPVADKEVRIIGFSMFLVDDVTGEGNESYVKGKFVKTIVSGEIDPTAEDFGLMGIRLIQ